MLAGAEILLFSARRKLTVAQWPRPLRARTAACDNPQFFAELEEK